MKNEGALAISVERTQNRKVGDVAVTHASQGSCPNTCPFFNNGCYAEAGPQSFTTKRLNMANPLATPTQIALEEAKAIDALSGSRPLRLHVVGDSKTATAARIVSRAAMRYIKRGIALGKRVQDMKVWTYTHAWRTVRRDHWNGVSVLASCETTQDIKEAHDLGYATAIVVETHPEDGKAYVKDGEKIVPCPEQTKGISCSECRMCWNDASLRDRGVTIAFAVHGASGNRVKKALHLSNAKVEGA